MPSNCILVVEDEGIIAQDIQGILEGRGYHVPSIAVSGREAIEKVEEIRPDLVLMDVRIKGDIDGIETSERIRDRFDIPIVYLTVYTDNETLMRIKETKPFGCLLKPFKETELCQTVQIAIQTHEAQKKLKETILKTQNDLEEANHFSDVGAFAITFAQELRNPLSAMKMTILKIKENNRDSISDRYLSDIEENILESDKLIGNFLSYAQTTRSR